MLLVVTETRTLGVDGVQYIYDSLNRLIEARYPDKVIRYTYDAAGNRTSEQVLSINPTPTLANLSPNNAIVGGAGFTLTVNGTNFVSGATIKWNGADRPTTFMNGTTLTASIPAADIAAAGAASVTVINPDPANAASSPLSFAINNPAPSIANTSPASVQAGGSTTILMVNGTNFVNGAMARWNGSNRATSVSGATQLTMVIDASDLAASSVVTITVVNPAPGGGVSNSALFTVSPCGGALSPASVAFGPGIATGAISVVTSTGACSWTATANEPWIQVTSGSNSGAGNGTVGYSVTANTGSMRNGTISVANNTFTVTQSGAAFEADVAPRPSGSGTVVVSDWVQVGRFSVGLDTPAEGSEAQRADCAPRTTLGDGRITVADWVQAGRYSVGLDPLTPAGGPAQITAALKDRERPRTPRELRVASQVLATEQGLVSLPVELVAQGGENGITFSLQYDPTALSYQGYVLGDDVEPDAVLLLHTTHAHEGVIGFGIALKPGEAFETGIRELLRVKFKALNLPASATEIRIGDGPAALGLADVTAEELPVKPVHGMVRMDIASLTEECTATCRACRPLFSRPLARANGNLDRLPYKRRNHGDYTQTHTRMLEIDLRR